MGGAGPAALWVACGAAARTRGFGMLGLQTLLPDTSWTARPDALADLFLLPSPPNPPGDAGEVLDPVKDQLLSSLANAVSSPVAMPGSGRAPPRSSLSQLLGTSK